MARQRSNGKLLRKDDTKTEIGGKDGGAGISVLKEQRIVVGFCSLGNPEPDFIDCIVKLVISGKIISYVTVSGTLLPYARNNIVRSVYLTQPDFTHILMVDDDMNRFSIEGIQQLIDADKPIISAVMLKRGYPYQVAHKFNGQSASIIAEHLKEGQPREVDFCGTAFTLIKKEVFEAIKEETDKEPIWFTTDRAERPGFKHEVESFIAEELKEGNVKAIKEMLLEAIILGQQSHFGTYLVGEDADFCIKSKKAGYSSWVHYGVPVGHIGRVTFDPTAMGDL